MASFSILLLSASMYCIVVRCATSRSDSFERILMSKAEDWGSWGTWVYCDEGQWGNTIQFKSVEDLGNTGDDVAGVAVRLICRTANSNTPYQYEPDPTKDGKEWGTWASMTDSQFPAGDGCPTGHWLTGFRTNVEDRCSGLCVDDETALNCIEMKCSDDTVLTPTYCFEGEGTWGTWDHCDDGYICGLRERFQTDEFAQDETALNGVQFKCCEFTTEAPTLLPTSSPNTANKETTSPPEGSPTRSPIASNTGDRGSQDADASGNENSDDGMTTVWVIVGSVAGCCLIVGVVLAMLLCNCKGKKQGYGTTKTNKTDDDFDIATGGNEPIKK